LPGAVQRMTAAALPAVAVPIAGASGATLGLAGVTGLEPFDHVPAPTAFSARTRNQRRLRFPIDMCSPDSCHRFVPER
jgi:hypothetical protein